MNAPKTQVSPPLPIASPKGPRATEIGGGIHRAYRERGD